MKKLTRTSSPLCLNRFKVGINTWKDVGHNDKVEIWKKLNLMQKNKCAYCECALTQKHIEHFEDRHNHPRETFEWGNLFGSCNSDNRCGHFKDAKGRPYDVNLLIKPDVDDPANYLLYLVDGSVVPREGLNERDSFRASETIRVFNLNEDPTVKSRRLTTFLLFKERVNFLYSLLDDADISHEDWEEFKQAEIDDAINTGIEFESAVMDYFSYNKRY